MNTIEVIVVRIYIMESSPLLKEMVHYLKNEAKIRGVSVFRAVRGFGETGEHTTSLLDLSLNLPLTIEFFDHKEKVEPALEHFSQIIKHEHIVFWNAQANV
ncbi:MAG: DUF190 domain-containing protein [Legionellaceae bacterium]|nr:DUF190 domain-containing protein [Legionellaceae bacterium]